MYQITVVKWTEIPQDYRRTAEHMTGMGSVNNDRFYALNVLPDSMLGRAPFDVMFRDWLVKQGLKIGQEFLLQTDW